MKRLVVLSGAGMSAESGLATFRDSGGLWEGHDVTAVASPEGWEENPGMVLAFYNERRRHALQAKPNEGHKIVADMENFFDVTVITQNVDDLHERAGSTRVIHLHGSLFKSRSSIDTALTYDIMGDIMLGDTCDKGSQLRPDIVWFGEPVPLMETAAQITSKADIFVVVGTSMAVYPAAGLIHYTKPNAYVYIVDPRIPSVGHRDNLVFIEEKATVGMKKLQDLLCS